MAASWPLSFQERLNQQGFGYNIGSTTIRSDTSTGPAKVRKRFTKAIDTITCSITITRAEYATFRTFYDTTLNNGVLPFTFNHPFTNIPTDFIFDVEPTFSNLGGDLFNINMTWRTA